jgi:hypothetical protein
MGNLSEKREILGSVVVYTLLHFSGYFPYFSRKMGVWYRNFYVYIPRKLFEAE